MMKAQAVIVLVCVVKSVFCANDGSLIIKPSKMEGIENENFQVTVERKDKDQFQSCKFVTYNNKVADASHSDDGLEYSEDEDKTICKLTIKPMKNEWKGGWNVTITDSSNQYDATFSVGMIENEEVETELAVSVAVGSLFRHPCSYSKIYGKIFNPDGHLVAEGSDAEIYIPFARVKDSGTWICIIQLSSKMTQSQISINLSVTEPALVKATVEETETQVVLLCHHGDVTSTPCLFETPNGEIIAPHQGVINDKYGYFGDDTFYDCGLTIQKPLEDGDRGYWKCMMASPQHATLLKVGDDVSPQLPTTNHPSLTIVAGNNLTVQCSVRLPLRYCYVRSAQGRIFSSVRTSEPGLTGQYTGLGLGQGDCQITIPGHLIWANESGSWICGMGAQDLDDIQIPIDVSITETPFRAMTQSMDADLGSSINMSCSSSLGYGLRYCRFMHPSGRSFNIGSDISLSKSTKYTYFGQSLEAGDCGLTITNIELEDLGIWVCSAAFVGDQFSQEYEDRIALTEAPPSFGLLIGMSVLVGVLASSLVGGIFYWKGRQRSSRPSVFEIYDVNYDRRSQFGSEHSESRRSSQSIQ